MKRLVKTIAVVLGTVVCLLSSTAVMAADFMLVCSAKVPASKVSKAELKDLLIGKAKTWKGGDAFQAVLPEVGAPELKWLAETVLGVVPASALSSKIKQEVFKGEMKRPLPTASDKETLDHVAKHPGGFGVVAKGAALPTGVKAIEVD